MALDWRLPFIGDLVSTTPTKIPCFAIGRCWNRAGGVRGELGLHREHSLLPLACYVLHVLVGQPHVCNTQVFAVLAFVVRDFGRADNRVPVIC